MTPAEVQALKNFYRPLRTKDAKVRDALKHVRQSQRETSKPKVVARD